MMLLVGSLIVVYSFDNRCKLHLWLATCLGCILFVQISFFTQQAIAVPAFPSEQQDVDPQWKLMSDWIRDHTYE
jgi:hypothetical protein